MKRLLKNIRLIYPVLILSLLCLASITYAVNKPSSIKIDSAVYKPTKSDGTPAVTCKVEKSGDHTNVSVSFTSAKRGSKSVTLTLTFLFSNSEYDALKTGDVINFEHGDNFSLISQIPKVVLTFSEGSSKKTKTKIDSVSKGSSVASNSSYMVNGSVEIINKRTDGCLDVNLNAMVQNASINMITFTLDPERKCIKDAESKKIKSVPSTTISGSLYPEKSTPGGSTSSGANTFCDLPSIPGGLGTSSGFTIPDFGNSSGFTIPDFGNSSGFTIPDFGDSSESNISE